MLVIRKIIKADEIKNLHIPKEMGKYIEVIISPAKVSQVEDKKGYFEIITEDEEEIKVPNWTKEEWNRVTLYSLLNSEDDNEDWEEIFDIKNR